MAQPHRLDFIWMEEEDFSLESIAAFLDEFPDWSPTFDDNGVPDGVEHTSLLERERRDG